ncbi:RNA methyltransferase [Flavihumibacter rivuli]|nr:RNA methyltransferase [Flavihumibacter rivuli]ULQ57207.1 RNA methyltransferase [Flavihumibacter rivuli]
MSHKKQRDEDGVFIAEGPKIVRELMQLDQVKPREVYGTLDWWESQPTSWRQQPWAVEVNEEELQRLSFLTTPNQVVAIFNKPVIHPHPGGWQIMLDGIQDPGNLGTIIRIADWFGIQQVVCSPDSADAYNPKVVQSSMASIGRVEVDYTDLVQYVVDHAHRVFYAATLDGQPIKEVKASRPGVLVIGNESKGIRPELMQKLSHFITIPRQGEAESLNAAVATGIILSHLIT